ncbi:hypothetical protein [Engelhardtia mirabilis]|uniref:HEAT repeat protein n=1 Tax=Engelhardtia mirabilis TaxID=2528011 RepID=A0A518BSD9_9BACT|nr:hypothetical protein Pla133_50090 [Planctomycetes bacterium Pla133]QDV04212.1 hypothetical protein Pla86_50070 [Planctomycetes bacterium Pla86]
MTRNDGREWVLRQLDGSLSAARQAELEQRLARDPELAEFARRQRRLDGLLEGLAEPPAESVDTGAALQAIRARLEAGGGDASPRGRLRSLPRWASPVRLAAAALVLLAGSLLWQRSIDGDEAGPQRQAGAELDVAVAPAADSFTGRSTAPATDPAAGPFGDPLAELPRDLPGDSPGRGGSVDPSDDADPSGGEAQLAAAEVPSLSTLLASLGSDDGAGTAQLTALLERDGDTWVALRDVERVLDATTDESVARGALRFLGAQGDKLSARSIEDALADPGLRGTALAALVDLGPEGWSGLGAALADPQLADDALAAWGEVADPAAARQLGRACERIARRGDRSPRLTAAAGLLADLGAQGLVELLERIGSGQLPLEPVLAALDPSHGDELFAAADGRSMDTVLIEFARVTACEGLVPRLTSAATDPRLTDGALGALAQIPGEPAGRALLEMRRIGRPAVAAVEAALAARDEPQAWLRLARSVRGERELAVTLAELLLGDPRFDGSAALAELARSTALASDLRLMALGATDATDPDSARALRGLVRTSAPDDARIAAAALVALARGLGIEGALALLPEPDGLTGELDDVLAHYSSSSLVRLARELRPMLPLTATDGDELP